MNAYHNFLGFANELEGLETGGNTSFYHYILCSHEPLWIMSIFLVNYDCSI